MNNPVMGLIESGEIETYSLVRVSKYVVNQVGQGQAGAKDVIVIADLSVVDSPGVQVGDPETWSANLAPSVSVLPPNMRDDAPTPLADINEQSSLPARPKPGAMAEPKSEHNFYGKDAASRTLNTNKPRVNTNPGLGGGNAVGTGTGSSTSAPTNIHPILSLTPYQNKWTIRVRVTSKTPLRTYNNSRGSGKLFSMDLADESGEMRATAFNNEVDRYYDMITPNNVYYISRGQVKPANKQYTTIKNDYELTFNADTTVTPCLEESNYKLPYQHFHFVKIGELQGTPAGTLVDVIGVVSSAGDVQTIIQRTTQQELKKREVQILDDSNARIALTLWNNDAEGFVAVDNPVLVVRGAKVSDFGQTVSLSCSQSSVIQLNPDIPDAHRLRGWFDSSRPDDSQITALTNLPTSGSITSAANWTLLALSRADRLGWGDKPDYFTVKATIMGIKRDNCMYMACPTADCNKKVIDQSTGYYRCEKCNREYPNYKWRLMLSIQISDFTEGQWITCFQDTAEVILGKSSEDLGNLKDTNEDEYNEVFNAATYRSYIFKLRAKMETFNDENRVRLTCSGVQQLNSSIYINHLESEIEKLKAS